MKYSEERIEDLCETQTIMKNNCQHITDKILNIHFFEE